MKICLVGPGIIPIPPTGWGAVESIIWECANELSDLDHDFFSISSKCSYTFL